jgi:hypothetical protein
LVRSNASSLTTRSLRLPAIGDSFIACGGLHFPPDVDYSCPSMAEPRMEDFESEKAFEIALHLPAKNF